MIELTRFDNSKLYVNCDLIERIEACHGTMITFINGKQLIVQEPIEEITSMALAYKQKVFHSVNWE